MTNRGHKYPGLWINFEAGEGAGKTTHQRLLAKYLKKEGFLVNFGREPGTTLAGEQIRKVLQDPNLPKLNPGTEMLLYVGAGIEFFEQVLKPALERGGIYLTDRWRDSTKAYQGYGLGIELNLIDTLTRFSCGGTYPDITFLIDIDAELGLSKISGHKFAGNMVDKIEVRNLDYHRRVNEGYREIARQNPDRFKVIPYIDGNPDKMQEQIRKHTDEFISEHGLESRLARI